MFVRQLNNLVCIRLFLSAGGSEGLFAQKTLEITDDILSTYKNQGWLWQVKLLMLVCQLCY